MLTNGMAEAKAEMEASQDDGGMGSLGDVFGQPDVLQKIAANPQTAAFLADPGFVAKIQSLQRNPSAIGQHLQDQRVLQVMGMLMGVNIQTPDAPMPQASAPPPKAKAPEPEPEPLTPEQEAALALRKEATLPTSFPDAAWSLPYALGPLLSGLQRAAPGHATRRGTGGRAQAEGQRGVQSQGL